LRISKDLDHQLDLSLTLGKLHQAKDVIFACKNSGEGNYSESAIRGKWKNLGDT